jgi:zinc transporter ZupT
VPFTTTSSLLPFGLTALSVVATFLGGIFTLRLTLKERLHYVLSFSAGALLGAAFFDLLPESIDLVTSGAPVVAAAGFAFYLVLTYWVGEKRARAGDFAAASLALHSLLDGTAIGLAFKAGAAVGIPVALAIISHDFADGVNTVGVILRNRPEGSPTYHSAPQAALQARAFRWLIVDALAPMVGVLGALLFTAPREALGAGLAFFAGTFIYIGAVDLLPGKQHAYPRGRTLLCVLGGMLAMYAARKLGSV